MAYNLLDEDENAFTLQHPDGSSFQVAKSPLSPDTLDMVKNLPPVEPIVPPQQLTQVPQTQDIQEIARKKAEEYKQQKLKEREMYASKQGPNIGLVQPGGGYSLEDIDKQALDYGVNIKNKLETQQKAKDFYANQAEQQTLNAAMEENAKRKLLGIPEKPLPGADKLASNMQAIPVEGEQVGSVQEQKSQTAYDPLKQYKDIMGQQTSAVRGLADIQGKIATEQEVALEDYNQELKKRQQEYETQKSILEEDHQDLVNKVSAAQIDPNRMWTKMSEGNKALAGIGMALGAFGSALTGQQNTAANIIQKAIDNDIEAQRLNLGKQQNLLTANMQRYRDIGTAEAATRVQMGAMLQGQIQQIASKYGGDQAKLNAQMLTSQIQSQMVPLQQQVLNSMVQSKMYGASGGEGGLPIGQEPLTMLSDPKYRESRVVVNGKAFQANSPGEGEQLRSWESVAPSIINDIEALDKIGAGALVPGSAEAQKAQFLVAQLSEKLPMLKSLKIGSKRLGQEADEITNVLKDPSRWKSILKSGIKNQLLFKDLKEETEYLRKNHLIGYQGPSRFKSFTPDKKE